eukprot:1155916-Pelagomonas_calceolata.AAC.2
MSAGMNCDRPEAYEPRNRCWNDLDKVRAASRGQERIFYEQVSPDTDLFQGGIIRPPSAVSNLKLLGLSFQSASFPQS